MLVLVWRAGGRDKLCCALSGFCRREGGSICSLSLLSQTIGCVRVRVSGSGCMISPPQDSVCPPFYSLVITCSVPGDLHRIAQLQASCSMNIACNVFGLSLC
ncbi:unnamed protein product [Ixodes persulcatus]